ncbi:MAG: hypothetical protein NT167_07000, partial [Verrucomicrobia bacterium]|nr:hypothetical protein [Verrucomicrobiota bacterium]
AAPTDSQEVEVVISSFQFMPLGAPQPAVLRAAVPSSASPFRLALDGEFDHWYEVQASTDLFSWQNLATMPAPNLVVDFGDPGSTGFNRRFYRTVTLP